MKNLCLFFIASFLGLTACVSTESTVDSKKAKQAKIIEIGETYGIVYGVDYAFTENYEYATTLEEMEENFAFMANIKAKKMEEKANNATFLKQLNEAKNAENQMEYDFLIKNYVEDSAQNQVKKKTYQRRFKTTK